MIQRIQTVWLLLALAFAVVVTSKIKTRNIARTMLFMPYLIFKSFAK